MHRCWRRGVFSPLALLVASIFFPQWSVAETRVAPEFALFLTHNNIFRSRFAAGATWNHDKEDFTSSAFEYDLDVGFGSFFRRYIFKDPDVEKSKFLTIRLGYAYIPNLTTDDTDADERRVLTDATFRLPLGKAWLLSDRNRVEFRHFSQNDLIRYRNKLRAERNFILGSFRSTPYANAEAYYDDQASEWNQVDGTLGIEFPWKHQTIMELYVTRQIRKDADDDALIGVTLQKHL